MTGFTWHTNSRHLFSTSTDRTLRVWDAVKGSELVTCKSEDLLLASLAVGGHGGALPEAAIAPRLCVELYESFNSGDYARARAIQRRLAPLGDALAATARYTGAAAMKEALKLLGLCDNLLLKPLHTMTEEGQEVLVAVMKDLELI